MFFREFVSGRSHVVNNHILYHLVWEGLKGQTRHDKLMFSIPKPPASVELDVKTA